MNKETHHINWLIFHEPVQLFLETAEHFKKELTRLTNGRITIDILTLEQYAQKKNLSVVDAYHEISNNNIQMSQMYVDNCGYASATDFFCLGLPFLFRSHDHATNVLEGKIGKDLLNYLGKKTEMQGLAFTYSGGYRCVASDTPLNSVEDFKGKKIYARTNPVYREMFDYLGCEQGRTDELESAGQINDSNMCQTTFRRYEVEAGKNHKYVINTEHSMYLTTIVANHKFLESLSVEDRMCIEQAALVAAGTERHKSVADGEVIRTNKQEQEALGIKEVVEWTQSEKDKLKKIWTPLVEKYKNIFSSGLVDDIINTK
jgi:TRAP-type C4-dicarboxylate transport system substrate-binding protein